MDTKNSEYEQDIPHSQTAEKTWHCKEEPHNNHETPERQTKQGNQLSVPNQDNFKTRWTQSKVQQNIELLQTPTMGVTINNKPINLD